MPSRGNNLIGISTHYNAQMKKAEEAAAAAEASRAQAAAAQQAQQAQASAPPAQRFRWCMRCAGTGTYAQYVDETNYGRTSRVQKQVRCDRCYGSGTLP